MFGPDETPLERTPDTRFGGTPPGRTGPPLAPIAIIGALIVLLIAGGAWWMSRQPAPANATPGAVTTTDAPIAPPPPPPLPALDRMDPLMRSLIGALSSRPELARWLATDDLVQQLAAAIDQASQGKFSSGNFKVIAPAGPFTVSRGGGRRTIDPAGYRRYNGLVDTVTSIDASAAARVYKTIRPRLNEAYRKMGHPDGDVDRALDQALAILIDTPVVRQPIVVVEGTGARWAYADPKLESLKPTQKQLLRMGPDHVDAMLVWLRALRDGLRLEA
ncbi:MAG: hypothetical protein A3J29_10540 [Acidobacteria bacterium RIFCSPLOWO2_12_FULL_67_14b]|nr:MAG: hypothetical protein A3J29_10540 [Acidobacteria bacterium RIFCSPLOWO2_12_FULL_67_14b]